MKASATSSFVPAPRALRLVAVLLPLCVLTALVGPPFSTLVPVLAVVLVASVLVLDALRPPEPSEISVERELPRRIEVGQASTITLHVRNRGRRTWRVRLVDGCPGSLSADPPSVQALIPAGERVTLAYPIMPRTRGAFAFTDPLLALREPRGFAEHLRTLDLPGRAKVLPGLQGIARQRLSARRDLMHLGGARRTRVLGRDGDFDRLRDFVTGDDLRHVDWKATARLRRPITRVWQAEKAQNLVVLVDGTRLMATGAGTLTKMDHAVRAALALGWAGLSAGDRVSIGVFDDTMRLWVPPATGIGRFGALLNGLYDQQPAGRFPGYREAARHVMRSVSRRSLVVWITDVLDADQGDELVSALSALRRRHLSMVVALDDPAVRTMASARPGDLEELYVRVGAAEVLKERALLLKRIAAAGAKVLDEPAGALGPELVDRYLDIKMRGLV